MAPSTQKGHSMASVNKAIIIGHLGRDPETRYTSGGDAVCNFSVATSESWNDKATGEKKEQTEWHRISTFGKVAEISGKYLKKGSQVYVEGSIRTRIGVMVTHSRPLSWVRDTRLRHCGRESA